MQFPTCISMFNKCCTKILSFAKFQKLLIGTLAYHYHVGNILICSFIGIPIFNKLFSHRNVFRSLPIDHTTQFVRFNFGKICGGSGVYSAISKTVMHKAFILTVEAYRIGAKIALFKTYNIPNASVLSWRVAKFVFWRVTT